MTAQPPLAVEIVDNMEKASGKFPGYRRAHARGACFQATFEPTGKVAELTTAAHLTGEPVAATVRFSNAGGSPHVPDGSRSGRGIAVKFHLADGTDTDLVGVNLPVFIAATPEHFLKLLAALTPGEDGQRDPAKLQGFLAEYPEAVPGFQAVGTMPIPTSYGTARYWAIHAFTWVNAQGQRQSVRYRWEPDLGEQSVTEQEAADWDEAYLTEELERRLADGPVRLTLHVQLAEPGDPTNDCTKAWPADRPELVVGHLTIKAPVADQAYWAGQVFDPTRVTAGIELSDDPVLAIRKAAYAVSYERRSHDA
ncbi:catalase family peroxidase [Kutzneria viridogrisea]|uniref:Catalase-related peroxidase n=2 Tax=Kutzneria TaxID=43356 RepID=W5W1A8_9PSEU|nr:catalase family peroxidase [Kutzneria albida]AHH94575.1 hypothetical protein KALB_1202 [Kutzneria albida DSM 43870]MBA8930244.1 catalase [Kutzneria viridogrisea]